MDHQGRAGAQPNWLLDLPLPFLSLRRLDHVLKAREGERILEIGPGPACSRWT